jgi:hypothetical protein
MASQGLARDRYDARVMTGMYGDSSHEFEMMEQRMRSNGLVQEKTAEEESQAAQQAGVEAVEAVATAGAASITAAAITPPTPVKAPEEIADPQLHACRRIQTRGMRYPASLPAPQLPVRAGRTKRFVRPVCFCAGQCRCQRPRGR